MDKYSPPFTVTTQILNLVSEIMELLGSLTSIKNFSRQPQLRRINRLKSIHSSCAIEGNTLTLDQVSAVIDGKMVIAPTDEIQEIKNAHEAYKMIDTMDTFSIDDILKVHQVLMLGLIDECGKFRSGGVGIFDGNVAVHIAPKADMVYPLMKQLLEWTKNSDFNPLIKYSVFHYEFEFIHPFKDGNGRMGRLLHSALLSKWKPIFAYLPVENIIKERQQDYYLALESSDQEADSTNFIVYMLEAILDVIKEAVVDTDKYIKSFNPNIQKLLDLMGDEPMSAKEILSAMNLKSILGLKKTYINPALDLGLIAMTIPDKPTSKNQRYYKI